MPTNFPIALDALANPSASDTQDSVTVPHAKQHADANDAIEALQAKVGVNGSADAASLDYQIAAALALLAAHDAEAHPASSITLSSAAGLAATNLQAGMLELNTEKIAGTGIASIVVSDIEPVGAADGTLWLDSSDI